MKKKSNIKLPLIKHTIVILYFFIIGKSLYEVSMVDWNIWTNKIKKPLIKGLFKEYLSIGTEVYPSQPHVRFKRISSIFSLVVHLGIDSITAKPYIPKKS